MSLVENPNLRLTAKPDKQGRHPKYKHLVMFEIEPHYGSYILTAVGHRGDALISSDDAAYMFGTDKYGDINEFGYLSDEYLGLLEEKEPSMLENPRRPPKKWMRDCVAGASQSARDPGAACGALWYHKMSESQRRAALARERKLEENQAGSLLIPVLIGGGILAAVLWWASSKKTETPTATGPALPPAAVACEVDAAKLAAWGGTKGIAAIYVPSMSLTGSPTADSVRNVLPQDVITQLNQLPGNTAVLFATKAKGYWEFWYWANDTQTGVLRQDYYADYCNFAANFGIQGHPANLFMF